MWFAVHWVFSACCVIPRKFMPAIWKNRIAHGYLQKEKREKISAQSYHIAYQIERNNQILNWCFQLHGNKFCDEHGIFPPAVQPDCYLYDCDFRAVSALLRAGSRAGVPVLQHFIRESLLITEIIEYRIAICKRKKGKRNYHSISRLWDNIKSNFNGSKLWNR